MHQRWLITQSDSGNQHASGGVAIWLRKNKFKIKHTSILDRIVSIDAELGNQKFRIIGIYAPTGTPKDMLKWWEDNISLIKSLCHTTKHLLVGGDFNFVTSKQDSSKGKIKHPKLVSLWDWIEGLHDLQPNQDDFRLNTEIAKATFQELTVFTQTWKNLYRNPGCSP